MQEFTLGTRTLSGITDVIFTSGDVGKTAQFYDADGVGGDAAVQFATIAARLALTNADFMLA